MNYHNLYYLVPSIYYISENKGTKYTKSDLDIIPIYFQKIANQVMFPVNMSVVYLNNKTQAYRINYFTKIII